jgi:hypothetical protein
MPCTTSEESSQYKEFLQNLLQEKTGEPAKELPIDLSPPWLEENTIPDEVQTKAKEYEVTLTLQQWQNLTPQQRFALIKLSRSSHENKNFLPALEEFGLLPP